MTEPGLQARCAVKKIAEGNFMLFKRFLCVFLCLLLCLPLCSCKKEDYVIYMESEDGRYKTGMTQGMFSYFLSQKKSYYLTVLMYNDETIQGDTPELWQRAALGDENLGKTLGEQFFSQIIEEAKLCVAATYVLEHICKYEIPTELSEYLEQNVLSNAQESYGSKQAFSEHLVNFGTTYDEYVDLYKMTINIDLLTELLYGLDIGAGKVAEEDLMDYFEQNYAAVREIYVNTAYTQKADGTLAPLSESEAAAAASVAAEINSRIELGEHFDDLIEEYKDNKYVTAYSDKIYFQKDGAATQTTLAAVNMTIGQVKCVEDDFGFHIVKKEKTDRADYKNSQDILSSINAAVASSYVQTTLEKEAEAAKTDEDKMAQFDISKAVLSTVS